MVSWWIGVLLTICAGLSSADDFCPLHCSCFTDPDGYVSANCSTLSLGGVQNSSIELLSLQPRYPGYPTRLAPRSFLAFPKVKFLWAVNCSVLNLPNDVFHGLSYVIRIDLSYNKIRNLNGAVFRKLGSLTTLKLRANPLELTPWDVIVSDSLQELDLGYCGLRTIPYGTFSNVPRLSRLYLDGNELRTLTYNMIPAGLRYVNLARNRITHVPTDVLSTMSNLRKLDLSKNPVNCTCNLLIMQDWFSGQGTILENGVICSYPTQYAGMHLSKINENELCTMEDVKRHRRINDIQSYGDSKSYRSNNLIQDPDFQSDQPSGQDFADVLFHDDRTHGLTHMEIGDKPYPPLTSDLSDENNKVAASKQDLPSTEIDLASPTQMADKSENESSKEESLISEELPQRNLDSEETEVHPTELSVEFNSTTAGEVITQHSKIPEVENTTAIWKHNKVFVTDDLLGNSLGLHYNETGTTKTAHEEMADEGYSPVFNMSEIMSDAPEEGSGSDPLELNATAHTKEETSTWAPSTAFSFPSSSSGEDYQHYDSNHDYSAEVSSTTEQMSVFVEEGSGDAENDTSSTSSVVLLENENNETTTGAYLRIDTSTDFLSSTTFNTTSEDYNISSSHPSSSTEEPTSDFPTTEEASSEILTTEETTTGMLIDISSVSSTQSSSPEPSSSSSSNDSIFGLTEAPSSTSAEPSSTEEPTTPVLPSVHELIPSSTEAPATSESPSSSSSPIIIPKIHVAPGESSSTSNIFAEDRTTPTSVKPTFQTSSSSPIPVEETEIIKETSNEVKSKIMIPPSKESTESEGEAKAAQTTLTYVIGGLLVALVLLIISTVLCRKVIKMKPCATKKKVRLPQDTEANHGTEMQDMLLPKPPENGIKIISHNGTQNGKDVKEEEVPVLDKDWEEKPEPIETVTARMSILAGPQTPVFIHKTLA